MRKAFLFILYFLFLWAGQLSSAAAAGRDSLISPYTFLLYLFFFSRAFVWFFLLREMDLIKAYSISSLNYFLIPLLSRFFLGEQLRIQYFIGSLFITGGVILFAMGEKNTR